MCVLRELALPEVLLHPNRISKCDACVYKSAAVGGEVRRKTERERESGVWNSGVGAAVEKFLNILRFVVLQILPG